MSRCVRCDDRIEDRPGATYCSDCRETILPIEGEPEP